MTFPGFARIYRVTDPQKSSAFVGAIDFSPDEGVAALTGELTLGRPVRVTWDMGGSSPSDFVWTTNFAPLIVSVRILDVLKEMQATGWDSYDVQLVGRDDREISGYGGLVVRGRCGPIQRERSVAIPKEFPGGVFPVYRGYFFDEQSWDGSDVFLASGTLHIFVVERVVRALRGAGVTGVKFERADKAERPTF